MKRWLSDSMYNGRPCQGRHVTQRVQISKVPVGAPDVGPYPLLSCLRGLKSRGPYWCLVYTGYVRIGGEGTMLRAHGFDLLKIPSY